MVAGVPATLFLLLAGCTFDTSGIPANGGDTNGESGADGPAACTPGCEGDALLVCEPERELVACPLGCAPEAGACRALVPSNGATAAHLQDVTASLLVPAGATGRINTDTGEVEIDGDLVHPSANDGVTNGIGFYRLDTGAAVLALAELTVKPGAILRAWGSRPLLVLSQGDVVLEGVIDVSGGCADESMVHCGGPGGGWGAASMDDAAEGCAPGGSGNGGSGSAVDETGGGGGGMGTDGAPGGSGGNGEAGGAGGAVAAGDCPGPALETLRGGAGGGAGGFGPSGGDGGGGGGAVQITSFTRIAITGRFIGQPGALLAGIHAAGAGGRGGEESAGGGGGGAGGAILLEAPAIELQDAVLAANGGGGGGGGAGGGTPEAAGQHGSFGNSRAPGGGAGIHAGGQGAAGQQPATPGAGGADDTGGGGGAAGIIRLAVPEAGLLVDDETIISPAYTRGDPAAE